MRWRMLEPIRQYGQERLASSGHRTTVRTQHRDHYQRLTERAERDWLGPNEVERFGQLRRDHANLRAALEFCLTEPGEERRGLEIAAVSWLYWFLSCSIPKAATGSIGHWRESGTESGTRQSPVGQWRTRHFPG
ncbi:hypothetical protein [Kibdelosporangium philippinense]|uniref:hypothetical protein n=1 Tax=Kibdelosporangium philippinense TaxID=211113 RepID=UPI00361C9A64